MNPKLFVFMKKSSDLLRFSSTNYLPMKPWSKKRNGALDLVEAIKSCLVKHMNFLEEPQREKVRYLWVSLGFVKSTPKRRGDKRLDLEMNLVDYQLYHGGRFIDILSDPKKDDRVTGFSPDGWQRKMLDVVDQYKSALIVAPTSAGKTFVSYYCIEKVLRKSNDDVVVYISPSKALMNQVVGSVYARFRNKPMVGGKVLYGTFSPEYSDNCMNCQVLVTVPECLEMMLLSPDPQVQAFVSRIKYVILDEVHCINASAQGHIWEHIFLLIRCPFLALSATISNVDVVKQWLQTAESNKALNGDQARHVEVITYDERWSELELAVHKIRECPREVSYNADIELFVRGNSVQSNAPLRDIDSADITNGGESRAETPVPSEVGGDKSLSSTWDALVQQFHPYGVYKPEKLKMFGIPADQRLTARQVVELYSVMSEIDEQVKVEFEPSNFFHYSIGSEEEPVWLTRKGLRDYETKLREKFVHWLEHEKEKSDQVFALMGRNVSEEFEKRSKPFNMRNSALHNVMPLMDDLKKSDRLPAICFSDDRDICQFLAIRVFIELQKREFNWRASPDFQRRFNLKAEDKAAKLAKRRRDEEEKERKKTKKKKTTVGEDGRKEGGRYERDDDFGDSVDQFAMQKLKLEEELKSFKFMGRWSDEDIYNNTIERLLGNRNRSRPSTLQLIRLFARGIGYHHDGMNAAERGAVEILFRAGFLGIVFSTSTLALGMNMPCKSVVFGIDTPMLTPLQFRQMSGRAGRRGFDPAGTVIFMALPTSKIRRLLTSSLATLRGNVPYTTSFMLKLFNYVKGGDMQGEVAGATPARSAKRKQALETTDVTNQAVRVRAALSLLKTPFALKTRQENKSGVLDGLLKFLTLFNVQLLRKYQLLNEKCELTGFAYLANHLSQFQPGNLMFVAILQSGVLNRLYKQWSDDKPIFKDMLVNIVAHIFTNKLVPIYAYDNQDDLTEAPVLKNMPEEVEKVVNEYNYTVDNLLISYLQLAVPNHQIQNRVFALSGKGSEHTSVFSMDVVSALDDGLAIDESFVPALSLNRKDHRGRRILRNSYAYDYWKRGDPRQLTESNKLMISEIWYLINDFNKVLSSIHEALASMAKPTDKLLEIVGEMAYEFDYKFKRGFGMKVREEEI